MVRENEPKLIPFAERNQKMKNTILAIINNLLPDEIANFQEEIVARFKYLKDKYPDHLNYRVLHILSGSTLSDSHTGVIENDFPGDDSVEKFVDSLANRYLK